MEYFKISLFFFWIMVHADMCGVLRKLKEEFIENSDFTTWICKTFTWKLPGIFLSICQWEAKAGLMEPWEEGYYGMESVGICLSVCRQEAEVSIDTKRGVYKLKDNICSHLIE